MKKSVLLLTLVMAILSAVVARAQHVYKNIPLPKNINGVNEEFSGMTIYDNRLYLEPQYGDHKETKLDGTFNLYSILTDSIGRVVDGRDTALTAYKIISVKKLNLLPDSVKANYEGFEAISIVNNTVFLSIETDDKYAYCFILKGKLDTVKGEVTIDPAHFISLRRYPSISNAGFESVTYLPKENKLLAYYEFNAMPKGGLGYLIDTSFNKAPEQIKTPFLYFRVTDIAAADNGHIYGINYFWNGDYNAYLNNDWVKSPEAAISKTIPELGSKLKADPNYLQNNPYAAIVMLENRKSKQWKYIRSFDGVKNNWEGIALYKKGALIVTDANRSSKQVCRLVYVDF
ncbi:hypothetical protein ACFFGT_21810 [Mucilaginibacter angelicae]|uniref:Phytase-like domain-containing protein n=1 Tax=Mucilaginibacter angelicae TaxID=869718 RepID=A0ABV6LBQ3_9SPHI